MRRGREIDLETWLRDQAGSAHLVPQASMTDRTREFLQSNADITNNLCYQPLALKIVLRKAVRSAGVIGRGRA
jgi:hypothetical protein